MPRGLIVLLVLACGVVAIAGMKSFAGILGPVFLALMLTIAVQPIQEWVRRRGWPRWIGMLGALIAVYAILLGLVGSLAISVAQFATLLPQYADDAQNVLDDVRDQLDQWGIGSDQIQNALSGVDFGKAIDLAEAAVSGLLGVFSNLFFVLALLLFMAFDGMSMHDRLAVVTRHRPEIAYAIETFASGTRSYLIVSTVFGLIVAVIDGAALWWLGIPLPVLWALLSFITNYIPNIGFILGLAPPAALGLLEGGPRLAIIVVVVYSVINVLIQSVIQPKFVGDAVGLSVTATFLALVFWAWVLGPLGALLAIPMSLLVKAFLIDIDPSTRWADVFIRGSVAGGTGDPTAVSPPESTETSPEPTEKSPVPDPA
ncbi:MAG: AI-2E family transporter [Nocardiaceae bacterium]|nr:AI-2E family transporter [Nocardiaceae bacterium]